MKISNEDLLFVKAKYEKTLLDKILADFQELSATTIIISVPEKNPA